MSRLKNQKKIKLSKQNKRTKWAPVWVVLKKLGAGKKAHPSSVTYVKRSWKRTKLKIKPRKQRKQHLG
jgi:ribosomal protein L39E